MIALQIKNLSKIYYQKSKSKVSIIKKFFQKNYNFKSIIALNKINLTVKQGNFFGLLGPNGAGKTTLIGILTSLVNKTSGVVEIFGHNIDKDLNAAKNCIGLVPQEFNFHIFESVENIIICQAGYYGILPKQAKKNTQKYLEILGLWDKRKESAGRLSGGMKRRLMIARALVHEPKMLILDEPTAGVDIELRRTMWTFLKDLNKKGTTIILTTHYLEEAESLCKDIAIIANGNIIENTSTRELIKKLTVETFIFDSLKKLPKNLTFKSFQVRPIDFYSFEIDINKGQKLNLIFEEFKKNKIEISSMRNKSNRLEELFIKLTNKI